MVDENNPEAPAAAEADVSSQPAVSPLLPPAQMWAAIHTRPRCEGKVEKRLKFKQIPVFLPVKNTVRTYGVRVRKSRLPLFTGYLFYDQTKIDRIDVIRTYGVVRIVETKDPSRLALELDSIARVLAVEGLEVKRHEWGPPGTPVEVFAGPMIGCRGELMRVAKGTRLVLKVGFLGAGIEVSIDESVVREIEEGEQSTLQRD